MRGTIVDRIRDKKRRQSDALQMTHLSGFPVKNTTSDIVFHKLYFHLNDGRCLLEDVSGEFRTGSMTAIMGPSGCGKSIFINCLMGRTDNGHMTGQIYVNETQNPTLKSLGSDVELGFVPQDDIMHVELTVRQVLFYQCILRNRLNLTSEEREKFIDNLLILLQIDHIQHQIVGDTEKRGISGGQKKRVNIGMELVSYPSILFLDEPT
eukprot:UN30120